MATVIWLFSTQFSRSPSQVDRVFIVSGNTSVLCTAHSCAISVATHFA